MSESTSTSVTGAVNFAPDTQGNGMIAMVIAALAIVGLLWFINRKK